MAKRRRKRRGRLILIALAVVIAGFIVRRTLIPSAIHYLAYRSPNRASGITTAPVTGPEPMTAAPASTGDRQ